MTHTVADIINARFSDIQFQAYKVLRKANQNIDAIKLAKHVTASHQLAALEAFVGEHQSFTESDVLAITAQTLELQAIRVLTSRKIPESVATECVKTLNQNTLEAIIFEGARGAGDSFFSLSGTGCSSATNNPIVDQDSNSVLSEILKDMRDAAQCKTKSECTKAKETLGDHAMDAKGLEDCGNIEQQITEALALVDARLALIQQKTKISTDISDVGKCKTKDKCESVKAKLDQDYTDVTTDPKFQDPIFDGMQQKLAEARTTLSVKLRDLEGSAHKEALGKLREELSKITPNTKLYSDEKNDADHLKYVQIGQDCRRCEPYHENVAKCKEYYAHPNACLDHEVMKEAMQCAIYANIKISCPTFESNPAGCKGYDEFKHETCIKIPEVCEHNTCITDADKKIAHQQIQDVRARISEKTTAKSIIQEFAKLYAVDSHSVIDDLPNLSRQFQKDYCEVYSCSAADRSALSSKLEVFSAAIKSCGDVQHPCDDLV